MPPWQAHFRQIILWEFMEATLLDKVPWKGPCLGEQEVGEFRMTVRVCEDILS